MKMEWKKISNNEVLSGDDFYISWLQDTSSLGISSWVGDDNNKGETALCKDGDYFILNGDFRKEYEKYFDEGFESCKKNVYDKMKKTNSSCWSEVD